VHMYMGALILDTQMIVPGYGSTMLGKKTDFGYYHLLKSLEINPDLKSQFPFIYNKL
jgi:hypothetical protein